jgi:hypothetical protein
MGCSDNGIISVSCNAAIRFDKRGWVENNFFNIDDCPLLDIPNANI